MQNQVSYISAHNGGIQMFSDTSVGIVGFGKTPESVAYVLNTKGIADTCYQSSSMDFASEYGFDTDDGAAFLFKKALELV
jgi:hypothetical protein